MKVAPFERFGAQCWEWYPEEHNGEHEPWELLEQKLDAEWNGLLVKNNAQETASPVMTERFIDAESGRRYVVRYTWTLPLDVPVEIALRYDEEDAAVVEYDG